MSKLVPPHGSESVKPLLLPEAERAEEGKRAEKLKKIHARRDRRLLLMNKLSAPWDKSFEGNGE